MSDEDCITPGTGPVRLAGSDEVEEILERLIALAQSERRDFLAYLLRMALIEARNQGSEKSFLPH
jgi:hypothetical protein